MGFSIHLRYNHSTLGLCWRLSPSVFPLELESSTSGGCHWDEWYSWPYLQTQSAWLEVGHLENSFHWRNRKGICSACVHILHCLWIAIEDLKGSFYLFGCTSCGTQDPVPWPGIKLRPLHWERRVLATGPGNSQIKSFNHWESTTLVF